MAVRWSMLPEQERVPCILKVSQYMKFRCVTLSNVTLRYVTSRQSRLKNTFERGSVNAKRMRDICSRSKIES